ncbi:CcdB family protein [Paracoccus sp. MBLB3053]|uniref:Toxin CcdB n=1 Tax=Paracoccus aurantius TaxID=3073814 RepID=A0ABU2HYN6_9RHOB|nr:CcdB family protein [Paracoccus sp. MBLB3053]MDS9470172.1 CcdB family protein [Paracoccus sp. MBLB3053]
MSRFTLYPALSGDGFLLDVQSDLLDGLNTRVVVPLMPLAQAPRPMSVLNPVFDIAERPHVMVTQFLSAVPAGLLRQQVGSLAVQSEQITRALDFLHQGF